jgi:hypothetical protein
MRVFVEDVSVHHAETFSTKTLMRYHPFSSPVSRYLVVVGLAVFFSIIYSLACIIEGFDTILISKFSSCLSLRKTLDTPSREVCDAFHV